MLNKRKLQAAVWGPILMAVLGAITGPAPAATAGGLRSRQDLESHLRSLSRRARMQPPESRAEALDRILDGTLYPGRCATPLLLALRQAGLDREGPPALLAGAMAPSPEEQGAQALDGPREGLPGSFRLGFRTSPAAGGLDSEDGDLDGTPDEARALLERLNEARSRVLEEFESGGAPAPWPVGGEPVHRVVVTDLPEPLEGYVWTGPEGRAVLLDRDAVRSYGGDALLRHQLAHLYQIMLTDEEPPWWYEAHAIWTADPAGRLAGDRAAGVSAYLADSRSGLGTDLLAAWEGTFLWPHYLAASGDEGRLHGQIWEELAQVPGENLLTALDDVLARMRGTSLPEEVRAFRIWNLFLGEFDDGRHYPFASALPATLGRFVRAYPAFWRGGGDVAPLGGAAVQLAASGLPGGWLLEFTGEIGAEWDLTLITVPSRPDRGPEEAVLSVIDGRGSTGIPWRSLDSVIAVVQNLGGESREPARFSLSARHDPLVPFDLMSVAPEEENGDVAIRWHTEREIDLLGWRLYRSRDPLSGYSPVNPLMIPAAGGPGIASYVFIDTTVEPGRKYYYLLEGVTLHGFTEMTHPVSVRTRRAPR